MVQSLLGSALLQYLPSLGFTRQPQARAGSIYPANEWHHLALIFGLWGQGGCSQQAPGTCPGHKGTGLSVQSSYLGTASPTARQQARNSLVLNARACLPSWSFLQVSPTSHWKVLEGQSRRFRTQWDSVHSCPKPHTLCMSLS